MMIAMSIGQTAAPIMAATKAASAATDFFAVIDAPKPCMTGLKEPDVSAHDNLKFDSVTFAYPSRPHVKVLDDLTISFESGKITAIVGASGSGKSTIVGLLERWYELNNQTIVIPESAVKKNPTEEKSDTESKSEPIGDSTERVTNNGSVFVGAHNLDTIDLKWWRSQIGLVQQVILLIQATGDD